MPETERVRTLVMPSVEDEPVSELKATVGAAGAEVAMRIPLVWAGILGISAIPVEEMTAELRVRLDMSKPFTISLSPA